MMAASSPRVCSLLLTRGLTQGVVQNYAQDEADTTSEEEG